MSGFHEWIKDDPSAQYPAEANRYHVYFAYPCPFAHRVLTVLKLKGLDHVISCSPVGCIRDKEKGWTFEEGCSDPHHPTFTLLREVYKLSDPDFNGAVSVPVLYDIKTQKVVNNESPEIMRMLNTEFNKLAKNPTIDLYPEHLRSRIDEFSDDIQKNFNRAVYRAGFAKTQEEYDAAYDDVFGLLDKLEGILSKQRYIVDNNQITESDVRAFTTLLRFDPVYAFLFKCNKKLISKDYPNLLGFVREIYQTDGVKNTFVLPEVKRQYYGAVTMAHLNPSGIIPRGPEIDYEVPHGRDKF